jgi:ATP-binding cassette subfamily F protein 3
MLISATGLTKAHGARRILSGASFRIDPGARIGLIGINGCGKTTLLRILEGEEEHEGGLARRRELAVARLEQSPTFPGGATVREAALAAAEAVFEAEREIDRVHAALAEPEADTDRLLAELGRLEERHAALGGHDADRRVEAILDGLGLPASRHDEPAAVLSGGERNRLALARILFALPDLLLLDEPTNHLDLNGVAFLERFLADAPAACIVVSHDRRFLDEVTRQTWEMEDATLHQYPVPYTKARQLREERRAAARKAYDQQQEYLRREEEYIRRYGAGQRAKEARGRSKRLARLERLEAPAERDRLARLALPRPPRLGNRVLQVKALAMGFDGRTLFDGLSLELAPGETLGIAGPNGAGKTTLMRALLGEVDPLCGAVAWGETARVGVLRQEETFPDESFSPLEYLRGCGTDATEQELRDTLGAMLFREADAQKPVRVLSGGEKKRLMLTRLLLEQHNVLIIDEPTNHLDAESCEVLELALSAYGGCLIVVTHDRALLDALADRVLWIEGGRVHLTAGGYRESAAARHSRLEARPSRPTRVPGPGAQPAGRSAGTSAKVGAPRPHARMKIAKLEERIIACEERKGSIHEAFADPAVYNDGAQMRALKEELEAITDELDELEAEYARR